MYKRIKECMAKKGIKYDTELERLAGITTGALKNIKNGHSPSPENAIRIASALGVSVNYLVTGEIPENAESVRRKDEARRILDILGDSEIEAILPTLRMLANSISITPTVDR